MTDYLEDLSQFMDEWNERAQRGEVQYTTALMRQMLHLFAKWLNERRPSVLSISSPTTSWPPGLYGKKAKALAEAVEQLMSVGYDGIVVSNER